MSTGLHGQQCKKSGKLKNHPMTKNRICESAEERVPTHLQEIGGGAKPLISVEYPSVSVPDPDPWRKTRGNSRSNASRLHDQKIMTHRQNRSRQHRNSMKRQTHHYCRLPFRWWRVIHDPSRLHCDSCTFFFKTIVPSHVTWWSSHCALATTQEHSYSNKPATFNCRQHICEQKNYIDWLNVNSR